LTFRYLRQSYYHDFMGAESKMAVVINDVGVTPYGLAKSLVPEEEAIGVLPDFLTPLRE
jgi:hypothetical protein